MSGLTGGGGNGGGTPSSPPLYALNPDVPSAPAVPFAQAIPWEWRVSYLNPGQTNGGFSVNSMQYQSTMVALGYPPHYNQQGYTPPPTPMPPMPASAPPSQSLPQPPPQQAGSYQHNPLSQPNPFFASPAPLGGNAVGAARNAAPRAQLGTVVGGPSFNPWLPVSQVTPAQQRGQQATDFWLGSDKRTGYNSGYGGLG